MHTKELAIWTALYDANGSSVHLKELAGKLPDASGADSTSAVRNSLRKLIKHGLVEKAGRGSYRALPIPRRETPANANRVLTLNCGVGRDSITMVELALEGRLWVEDLGFLGVDDLDCVVFSDTGREWDHTYALVDKVKARCTAAGLRFFALEKPSVDTLRADHGDVTNWDDIEAKAALGGYHLRLDIRTDLASRRTVVSLGKGDCTDNHKIQPIRKLINDIAVLRFGVNNRSWAWKVRKGDADPHISLVGIAADETSRLEHNGKAPLYVTERHPLVDMGIAKTDEFVILDRVPEFAGRKVKKSGCTMCPYQPAGWWWALSVTDPTDFEASVAYEALSLTRNPNMVATGFKKAGKALTIPEVVANWRAKNPDATVEAVLSKEYSRCTKEARKMLRAGAGVATTTVISLESTRLTKRAA